MDLPEFLLARIAEDDAEAKRNGADAMTGYRWKHYPEGAYVELQSLALAHWRRVLRECEAKRRIVELHQVDPYYAAHGALICLTCYDGDDVYKDDAQHPCPTLRALAAVYADHPDYDDRWKP